MQPTPSPYDTPIVDAIAPKNVAPRLTQTMTQIEPRLCLDATITVYILAYARDGLFYIDVAREYGEIHAARMHLHALHEYHYGPAHLIPLMLVVMEPFEDEATAMRRCAELRAMPQGWQRRVIDAQNPAWLGLDALAIGSVSVCRVGEYGVIPCGALCAFCDAASHIGRAFNQELS